MSRSPVVKVILYHRTQDTPSTIYTCVPPLSSVIMEDYLSAPHRTVHAPGCKVIHPSYTLCFPHNPLHDATGPTRCLDFISHARHTCCLICHGPKTPTLRREEAFTEKESPIDHQKNDPQVSFPTPLAHRPKNASPINTESSQPQKAGHHVRQYNFSCRPGQCWRSYCHCTNPGRSFVERVSPPPGPNW